MATLAVEMPNALTGDYHVVAEFSALAVNRLLAAMHQGKRLLHSLSLRVSDTLESSTIVRSVVDAQGNASPDRAIVTRAAYLAENQRDAEPTRRALSHILDPVVNANAVRARAPDFGHLKGIAQLQLGPPTVELTSDSTTSATFRTPVRVRYFADPDSTMLPGFLRGEIFTTVAVSTVSSGGTPFVTVNPVGVGGNIRFHQISPSQPLSVGELSAINKALRNALITGFQPSNTLLPANVVDMHFKGMPGGKSVAVMMNLADGNLLGRLFTGPDPESVTSGFMRAEDLFALGVAADYILKPFAEAANTAVRGFGSRTFETTTSVQAGFFSYTFKTSATVTLDDAVVELQEVASGAPGTAPAAAAANISLVAASNGSGQILLSIPVHIHFTNDSAFVPAPPDAHFTVGQAFSLLLDGREVGLQRVGEPMAQNADPNIAGQVKGLFANAWRTADAQVQARVRSALSPDSLRAFVNSLLNPPRAASSSATGTVQAELTYTGFAIKRSGVILHGMVGVADWPPARVTFAAHQSAQPPQLEYNALNSWIPGGTIQNFTWTFDGRTNPPDWDKFVSSPAPPSGSVPSAIARTACLVIEGFRITASGPVMGERIVSRRVCKRSWIPGVAVLESVASRDSESKRRLPDVLLTEPSPDGTLTVIAHVSPWESEGGSGSAANFLVHFPDDQGIEALDRFPRALELSGRLDAATAILCVLSLDQRHRARDVHGVLFSDDAAAWETLLKVKQRPTTVLLDTVGQVVWRKESSATDGELAEALRTFLRTGSTFRPRFLELLVTVEERAPNFLFEYASGQMTTLRKLTGRSVVVVFCKRSSNPSLESLANLVKAMESLGAESPFLLAVHDEEAAKDSRCIMTAERSFTVTDFDGAISRAYGVNFWPTTVMIDEAGIIRDIRYGLITEEDAKQSSTCSPESEAGEVSRPGKDTVGIIDTSDLPGEEE